MTVDPQVGAPTQISGIVTDEATHAPIPGIEARLYREPGRVVVANATTDEAGAYVFTNPGAGTYRVRFSDPVGGRYTTEFWDDAPTYPSGDDLVVGAGGSATASAGLARIDATYVVSTAADGADAAIDGVCEATPGAGDCTLRAAVDEANAHPAHDTVQIAAGIDPVLGLPGADEDDNATGDIDITTAITIEGGGATIDAAGLDRVIDLPGPSSALVLRDVTVTGGYDADQNFESPSALFVCGSARLEGVAVAGNQATGSVITATCGATVELIDSSIIGSGLAGDDTLISLVYADVADLHLQRSVLQADVGWEPWYSVHLDGALVADRSTLVGSIWAQGWTSEASVTLTQSTVVGGAVGIEVDNASVDIRASTVTAFALAIDAARRHVDGGARLAPHRHPDVLGRRHKPWLERVHGRRLLRTCGRRHAQRWSCAVTCSASMADRHRPCRCMTTRPASTRSPSGRPACAMADPAPLTREACRVRWVARAMPAPSKGRAARRSTRGRGGRSPRHSGAAVPGRTVTGLCQADGVLSARLDVSGVPPQRGQVAKRCPVRAQWDALAVVAETADAGAAKAAPSTEVRPQPAPTPATITRRLELSDRFVADVVATLVEAHPDAVVVPAAPADQRIDATVEAMAAGAPVIVAGRLPDDEEGRRRGDPAVLVAAGGGGYHPIEVALHRTLERPRSGAPITPVVSSLAAPWLQAAGPLDDVVARPGEGADAEPLVAAKRKGDLLQLAHLRRMLEACGQAASSNVGGVIGTDGIVVWYDLDAPLWTTPSTSEGTKVRSTMAVYDFEYGFRLDVVATAQAHAADPSVPLLVVPVRIGECSSCPWWASCRAELEARHDVSLLPRFGWNRWKRHRERGVATIADLAGLDHRTAVLVDQQVDLAGLLGAADDADAGLEDDAPLGPLVEAICGDGAEAAAAHLDAAGITTVGELRQLDRRAAAYTGVDVGPLAPSIDTARARLTEAPAMLARGRTSVAVPRGDVEIDLDLESTEAGVYLWGARVNRPRRHGTGHRGLSAVRDLGPARPPGRGRRVRAAHGLARRRAVDAGGGGPVLVRVLLQRPGRGGGAAAAGGLAAGVARSGRSGRGAGAPPRVGRPVAGGAGEHRHRRQHGAQGAGADGRVRVGGRRRRR
ncbi:MAG: carboxypeptidase regulatory-like domain-containing protein [Acidimicrobiales bacterium]